MYIIVPAKRIQIMLKKQKRALKSLVNSDEYKQIVSDNNRLRKNNEFMAE